MADQITNYRTRLTAIDSEEYAEAKSRLEELQGNTGFAAVVTVLEQELVTERELYEQQAASEFQRGRINMLHNIISLLTGE